MNNTKNKYETDDNNNNNKNRYYKQSVRVLLVLQTTK